MFGDDPDTTETTARVASGTIFGRAREGFDALCREGFGPCGRIRKLRKQRGEGGWTRWAVARLRGGEERERGPGICFRRPKTSDARPAIMPL